jgi:putative hydrolase of the HAD superfamily
MLRALVLDFDGSLMDTETPAYESVRTLWATYDQDLPMDWWLAGMGTDRKMSWVEELERRVGEPLDRVTLMEQRKAAKDAITDESPLLPGVVELLDAADRGGIALAIASSSPHEWVDRHLHRVGVFDRFVTVSCRDDVGGVSKPSPDVYLHALECLGVAASFAAALEDSPNGLAAANAAGLRTAAIPSPLVRSLDFSGAHLILNHLTDISAEDLLARLSP